MSLPDTIIIETYTGSVEHKLNSFCASRGTIVISEPISSETSIKFALLLKHLAEQEIDIQIYIDCPGGEVNAGLVMYDLIQAYPFGVDIYCIGIAASMAAVLLAGGRTGHRFILPHASVMIHEPLIANGFGGSATTIERKAHSIIETKSLLNGILAKHTNKTISEINNATSFDNFMNANEAVDFGICDAIKMIY